MARGLVFRKLANKVGERIPWTDKAGTKHLINPETGKREPWPLLGLMIEEVHPTCTLPTKTVDRYVGEGLMKLEGEKVVTFPGGPPNDPNAKMHVFRQCDFIVIKTAEGDVRYKVTHNPGKYPDGNTTRVDHFYDLELVEK